MVMDSISSNNIPSPEKIRLDFEAGAIKTVKDVYPTTTLIGCDVRWKRCLREKLRQLGLLKWTNNFEDMQVFVMNLWGLSIFRLTRSSQSGRNSLKALFLILTKNKLKIPKTKLRQLLTTHHWSSSWSTLSLIGRGKKMLETQRDKEGRPGLP